MELVSRSDGLKRRAVTAEDWAEVRRLEDMAVRAYELESLGERILSSVVPARSLSAPPAGTAREALSARLSALRQGASRRKTR